MPTKIAPTHHTRTKRTVHTGADGAHRTVLFNCNCHTFESVIIQLVYATGMSEATACKYAEIVHTYGKATVFQGSEEACSTVADKLAEIGLVVRVEGS